MRKFKLFLSIIIISLFSGCLASTAYQEMSPEERLTRIQDSLIALGYMAGEADGIMGPKTRAAITKFQSDNGMVEDGEVSQTLYIRTGVAATRKRDAKRTTQKSPALMEKQTSPGNADVCTYANWNGVVQNLADLFACDQGRAIASLSESREVDFHVTSVAFQEGKLYAKSYKQDSLANAAGQSLQKRDNFSWNDWHSKTQRPYFTFVCILPGARAEDVRSGSIVRLRAKLVSYSGTSGSFECK